MQDIEKIYKENFETVNKYLFCLTKNWDLAEELTEETFYRAVENIGKFKGESKISTYLCQIAKNLYYDTLRKNKKIVNTEYSLLELESEESTEEKVILNDEKITLYKNLQKLDEKTREVIYLKITGELSFKEIGDILNKTENWARVTFYRGKQTVQDGDLN